MANFESSNFTQEVILPSQGLLNPEIPEGKVTQRCLMVADQKYLAGSSSISLGSTLQQLIQRTVTAPESFDVSRLTVADTVYLLFKLRILSYGKEYSFRTRCPECGNMIEITADLSELSVETLEEDRLDDMSVVLPHKGDTVYVKVLTNKDLSDISNEIKRRKKRNSQDESEYVIRVTHSIDKIELAKANKDGKKELTHPIDIERYVNSLTSLDATVIMDTKDSLDYGLVPVTEHICPECKGDIEVNLQLTTEFFRPKFNKRSR